MLEDVLLEGHTYTGLKVYPKINHAKLVIQLLMFHHNYDHTSLSEASACFKTMITDLISMYTLVLNLLRLLVVFSSAVMCHRTPPPKVD